jgi:biopolymer transport protein ExbB
MKMLRFSAMRACTTPLVLVALAMLLQTTPSQALRRLGDTSAPRVAAAMPPSSTRLLAQLSSPLPTSVEPPSTPADGAGKLRTSATTLRELSPWSMFLSADALVKAVMISLAFASLVTWTMFLAKTLQLSLARRRLRNALARIEQTRTLNEAQLALGRHHNPLSFLLAAAVLEVRISAESAASGIQARAASRFAEIVRAEARAARDGMGVLATIGATSPFVGLFGTVWGIMNSFIGISKAQTTNLAVVAPGIAEALLATAIGLAAAIPAVIIYNHFSRTTRTYLDLLGRASGAIGRLLSRDLDRNHSGALSRKVE